MEWLFELLKRLVFGSIIIGIVEVLIPEGGVKKHYNYISALIMLTILFTPFLSLDFRGLEAMQTNELIFGDNEKKNFEKEFKKKQKNFLETSLGVVFEQEIENLFKEKHEIIPEEIFVLVYITDDLNDVYIRKIELSFKNENLPIDNFLNQLVEKFGVLKENIKVIVREDELDEMVENFKRNEKGNACKT